MDAIVNPALLNIDKPLIDVTGFSPVLTFTVDFGDPSINISDGSSFGAGDTLSKVNVKVSDVEGNTVVGHISAAAGNTGDLDISSLVLTDDIVITATIPTVIGCVADGTARNINSGHTSGSLGSWTVGQFSSAIG